MVRMFPDGDTIDGRVMVHHNNIVRRQVNVKLTAPEAVFLGFPQRSDGILRIPRLFTLPETPVRTDFNFFLIFQIPRHYARRESRNAQRGAAIRDKRQHERGARVISILGPISH